MKTGMTVVMMTPRVEEVADGCHGVTWISITMSSAVQDADYSAANATVTGRMILTSVTAADPVGHRCVAMCVKQMRITDMTPGATVPVGVGAAKKTSMK